MEFLKQPHTQSENENLAEKEEQILYFDPSQSGALILNKSKKLRFAFSQIVRIPWSLVELLTSM